MDYVLALIAALLAAFVVRKLCRYRSLSPLLPRRYNFGKRGDTFRETLVLLEQKQARVLVETGVARRGLSNSKGDGASTIVFGQWAKNHDARLYSVDIDAEATAIAARSLADMNLLDVVTLTTSDSVAYLESFDKPVDFLYLDSFDYHKTDLAVQAACQEHHLKEFQAIEHRLHDRSFVLIDDCHLPGGGKGKTVIDYMLQHGWNMHMYQYQALLTPPG